MQKGKTKGLKVRKKYEDFLVWLFERINNFPRKQKFLLGKRIGNLALDISKDIIIIQYSKRRQKEQRLKRFNLRLEIMRDLMRLAWKMKFFSNKQFAFQESKIDEVGRMVHGLVHSSSRSQ